MSAPDDFGLPTRQGPMQQALDESVREAPELLLRDILSEKLKAAGVSPKAKVLDAILANMKSGADAFDVDDGAWLSGHKRVTIRFTEADTDRYRRRSEDLLARMPELVKETTQSAMRSSAAQLRKQWPAYERAERREEAGFRRRLLWHWGGALRNFRRLLTMCSDVGEKMRVQPGQGEDRYLHAALVLLHLRGCQIAAEILTLLECGYADGALARWRTLYEIGVVATLIADWGPVAARRYLDHEAVESMEALKEYERCAPGLGLDSIDDDERAAVVAAYDAVKTEYGEAFAGNRGNGWASSFLSNNPSFRDLEAAAQRSNLRMYYKVASYGVHAGVKSVTYRHGVVRGHPQVFSGASNAGLSEPCERAARELVGLTALLYTGTLNLDEVVELHCLSDTADEIAEAAERAARDLERDERLRRMLERRSYPWRWSWRRVRRWMGRRVYAWRRQLAL